MSGWRQSRASRQDAPTLIAAVNRFGIEQAREVYLALRDRPRPYLLVRPTLSERLSLFTAERLPTSRLRVLAARVGALAERWR